jgi:AcrR family transcriptional regulator
MKKQAGTSKRATTKLITRRRASHGKREPLGRTAWLEAARDSLIEEGTAGVEVNKLAKRLNSSRGGFYWFFSSRQQLLDELLKYWAQSGTAPFEKVLELATADGMTKLVAVIDLWIDERDYDPKWDGAVRDWARTSDDVHEVVAAVDARRVDILERIFNEMGYQGKEAHVRARVTYYHQVGYYALGVRETQQERRDLLPWYRRILTGRD